MYIALSALAFLAVAFVLLGFILAIKYRRVVPTNMVHIVQSAKLTTAFGRGKDAGNSYYAWPSWIPHFGVTVTAFPESIFQVNLGDYAAYDKARLPFIVDVTAFFRIEDASLAAQRVATFSELNNQLQQVLQGAVRRVLATNTLEETMQARSELGLQFTEEVKDQIEQWGVLPAKSIEFMDLRDAPGSQVILDIMSKEKSRIDKESRMSVADNKRAALLAEIDADRVVDVQRQDAEQQVGQRTAEKEKAVGIAREQAQQDVLSSAIETAGRTADVKKVQDVRAAEIQRDVAAVKAEEDKTVATVNAEARKQTQIIIAEGEKQAQVVKAEGDRLAVVAAAEGSLAAALKDAEGIQARGISLAAAEEAMLLAPISTQITLAKEIGENTGYQHYLVTIAKVDASKEVGIEMAKAMQSADLKVIATSGEMQSGVAHLGDVFTPAGGTKLTGMLSALAQTDEGKAFISQMAAQVPTLVTAAGVAAVTSSPAAGAIAGVSRAEA